MLPSFRGSLAHCIFVKLLYFFVREFLLKLVIVNVGFRLVWQVFLALVICKVTQVLWQPQPICKLRIVVSKNIFINFDFWTWLRFMVVCRSIFWASGSFSNTCGNFFNFFNTYICLTKQHYPSEVWNYQTKAI